MVHCCRSAFSPVLRSHNSRQHDPQAQIAASKCAFFKKERHLFTPARHVLGPAFTEASAFDNKSAGSSVRQPDPMMYPEKDPTLSLPRFRRCQKVPRGWGTWYRSKTVFPAVFAPRSGIDGKIGKTIIIVGKKFFPVHFKGHLSYVPPGQRIPIRLRSANEQMRTRPAEEEGKTCLFCSSATIPYNVW